MTADPFVSASAPARVQPDSRPVVLTTVWLVGCLAVVSFVLGIPGLVAVGAWAGLPPVLRWGVPLIADGGLVIFALVATVRRARLESARFAWACLTVLTLASMGVQVAHVASVPGEGWQQTVGMALAAAFPAVVFASTHSLLDLAVAPAPTKKNKARKATSVAVQKPKDVTVSQASATRGRTVPARAKGVLVPASGTQTAPEGDAATVADKAVTGAPAAPEKPRDREELRAQVLELRSQTPPVSYGDISKATGVAASTAKRWVADAA